MHTEFAHLPKVLRTILQTTRVLIAPEGAGRDFLMNHYRFFAVEVSTGNNVGGIVESADVSNAMRVIKDHDLLATKVELVTAGEADLYHGSHPEQTSSYGKLLNVAPTENANGTSNTSLRTLFSTSVVVFLCIAAVLFALGLAFYLPCMIVRDIQNGHTLIPSGTVRMPSSSPPVYLNRSSKPIGFWSVILLYTAGTGFFWALLLWLLKSIFFSSAKPKQTVTKSEQ